jgi:hypothetical protein
MPAFAAWTSQGSQSRTAARHPTSAFPDRASKVALGAWAVVAGDRAERPLKGQKGRASRADRCLISTGYTRLSRGDLMHFTTSVRRNSAAVSCRSGGTIDDFGRKVLLKHGGILSAAARVRSQAASAARKFTNPRVHGIDITALARCIFVRPLSKLKPEAVLAVMTPSIVVAVMHSKFSWVRPPGGFKSQEPISVTFDAGSTKGLIALVDKIPLELLSANIRDYAELVLSMEYLRQRAQSALGQPPLLVSLQERNALNVIWAVMRSPPTVFHQLALPIHRLS